MTALSSAFTELSPAFRLPVGRLAFDVALFMLALMVPSLIALGIDERQIADVSVWSKPLKFQISLALHFLTVVALLPLLFDVPRWLKYAIYAGAISGIGEIVYITVQAARARASHFNDATGIEATLYSLMGLGATVLVLMTFLLGLAIWKQSPRLTGLNFGAASGLMVGSVLTLVIGFALGSGAIDGPGHWVGGPRSDAAHLPVVGWVTSGGDLRVSHFFATHLMQALPIFGLIADRVAPEKAVPLTIGALVLGVLIVAATFVQAVMGLPLMAR